MKKIVLIISFMMVLPVLMLAQHAKPSFSFNEEMHDFGTIKEEDGKVECTFNFTNIGGQPLVIHNVAPSCGCTSSDWTKMPIPPGGKGYIKATFNPENRPGPFNKTVTVASNADEPSKILRITGQVQRKPLSIEELYPKDMDGLRLKAGHLSFTRVNPGTVKTEEMDVINTTSNDLKVIFRNVPEHITIKLVPDVIKANEKGKLIATFDANKISDWGFVVSQIYMIVGSPNDKDLEKSRNYFNNRLSVSATIEEDFSSMTPEEMANAPVADFKDKVFDFGTIKQGDVVSKSFVLTNDGKSNLIIRKVKASCGCTAVKPSKNILGPGESTEIVTEFNSRGKSGRQSKSVTIITNDPKSSTILLRVTGNVEVK